jgi:flagellar motor switch protein FliN/FliY
MGTFSTEVIDHSIKKTLMDTFETMLSMSLEPAEQGPAAPAKAGQIVGAVNFGGEVIGVMSLHVDEKFGRIMTAAMLGMQPDEVEDEEQIKDVIGELTNIVAGNLKTDFLDGGLQCIISAPSITRGSDFKIDPLDIAPIQHLHFAAQDCPLRLEYCLKEESGAGQQVAAVGVLSSAEINDKINSVDIRTAIINSVIDVFFTMLSMEIEHIGQVPASFEQGKRTVGSVSFAGDVDGIFNIQVNDDFGRIMTAAMLGMSTEEVEGDEQVFDVLREMSNIIGGNLKSQFVDAGLSCILSTPAITNGLDFTIEPLNTISPQRILFAYQDHTIIVEAGVKRLQVAGEAAADLPSAAGRENPLAPEAAAAGGSDQMIDDYHNLDIIMDIPLEVTVELGRNRKKINDLLKISDGSVIELEQLEGEPVDILVNKTLIARGEVVVEKEKYGIRISQIISRKDRIKRLF